MSLPAGCTSLVPGADAGFSFGGGGGGGGRQWRIQDFSEGGCLMSGPIRKVGGGGGGGGGGGSPLQVRYTKSGGGGAIRFRSDTKSRRGGGAVRFRSDTFVWHTATCTYLRTT